MKMPMIATLAFGIALGAVLSAVAESGPTADKSELDALRQQVQALETRFQEATVEAIGRLPTLEARVAALERRLAGQSPDPNGLTLRPSLHGRPVPENWSRREFNGMPYYVIPLRHERDSAAQPAR
jgi:hypothetical protein